MLIKIVNFQSLADATVDVQGLTVLIGGSNVGKSAFIRAVEGALFNRPGDDFVRKGAAQTTVSVIDLPTVKHGNHSISWAKGSANVNLFTVDNEKYDKVGLTTPQHLQIWGYRDVKVDKEYLRPQIHTQFEVFFLLKRSGSFISDVLTLASRLSVLLSATDSCSKDLKKNKNLQNIRKGDFDKASTKLESMKDILLLTERIKEIGPKLKAAREQATLIKEKRNLLERYKSLKSLVDLKLPDERAFPANLGSREAELRTLITKLQTLRTALSIPLPEQVSIPDNKIARVDELRQCVVKLKSYSNLPPLPTQRIIYENAIQHAEEWRTKLFLIRQLSIDYSVANAWIRQKESALSSITIELEEIESQLSILRADLKICPLCERPMEENHEVHSVV